jgi:hypothetical protein
LGKAVQLRLNRWVVGAGVVSHFVSGRSLFRHQIGNELTQCLAHILALYHHVEHAVFEQIFRALKAFGQLFADRVLNNALSGKANQRVGFRNLCIA